MIAQNENECAGNGNSTPELGQINSQSNNDEALRQKLYEQNL